MVPPTLDDVVRRHGVRLVLPDTYSMTKYGTPCSVVPPSISRAMFDVRDWRRLALPKDLSGWFADELIVASARVHDLTLITTDTKLRGIGMRESTISSRSPIGRRAKPQSFLLTVYKNERRLL